MQLRCLYFSTPFTEVTKAVVQQYYLETKSNSCEQDWTYYWILRDFINSEELIGTKRNPNLLLEA